MAVARKMASTGVVEIRVAGRWNQSGRCTRYFAPIGAERKKSWLIIDRLR